jgi:hypothetical protein
VIGWIVVQPLQAPLEAKLATGAADSHTPAPFFGDRVSDLAIVATVSDLSPSEL